MAKTKYGCLVVALVMVILVGSTSWAASISGTLTNESGKTGRAYIMLKDEYGNSQGFGTSILITTGSGSTNFILSGVAPGNYQLGGYLDTRASGHIYSGSPLFGNSSPINVASGDLSGLNYTISSPLAQSVVTPNEINAVPMANGLFVIFNTPQNTNGIEIADSYNIYWSTSPDPSATQTAGGGSIAGIPSVDDGHQGIPGLVNGTAYYVAVEAVLDGVKSGRRTTGPLPAGNPAGGYTLSGTVTFSGITPAKPLIIVAYSDSGMYVTRIAAPTAGSQAYTIQGVQAGTYDIGAFLDQNSNSRIDDGDLVTGFDESIPATVTGNMTLPTMTLVNQAVYARLTTRHNNNWGGDSYFLNFYFEGRAKRPTHINLIGGPGMGLTSLGPNDWGEFDLRYSVPKPAVGDSYSATVYFSDGTSSTVSNMTVSGTVDVLPVMTYPVGQTGTDGTSPRFAWYLTGLPSGDYSQNLQLYNQNGDDWKRSVPITQNSYQYDGPTLNTGNDYNGEIEILDSFGNVAENYFQFQPTSNQLRVTGVSPSTLACGSSTQIIIDGNGFDSGYPSNNLVYFNNNSTPAHVNWASSAEISVNLPDCATSLVPSGPIKVTTNNVSAALQDDFTPQVYFDYFVKNSSGTPLSGVTIEVEGTPAITTTSTDTGNFRLSGIPSGLPFQQKLSLSGYLPSYSARIMRFSNFTDSGSFALFTASEVTVWGVISGKGVIRSRVVDNTGAYMAGATVSAYSTLHNSSSYYTVAYTSGTTTQTDGRYYVLNVEEGDTVVVTAAKNTYNFNNRTFVTHANAVSQGLLTGTPKLSVSGMTPSGPTGSTITINGNNFSTTANQNTICFQNSMGGTNCTNAATASATQLTVVVPCGTGTGLVTVTANGQNLNAGTFTVPNPTISGFSPANGPATLPVTITGTNFSTGNCAWDNMVTFAGMPYQQINQSSTTTTQIVFNTPYVQNTTTGTISVTTPSGMANISGSYTAYPYPYLSGTMNPSMAAPGETVTVGGTFYDLNKLNYQVTVGGVSAPIISISAGSLVFTVPANAGYGGTVYGNYYGTPAYGPYLTIIYRLSAAITGNGTINSTNGLGGLTCTETGCNGNFYYNEPASLRATPSTGYRFAGWSGACEGTGDCDMYMTTNKSVTATFAELQYIMNGTNYYSLLQDAFDGAANGNTIQVQAEIFTDPDLVFNKATNVQVKFKGGYDNSFNTYGAYSTLDGKLSVRGGTLRVEKLKIK